MKCYKMIFIIQCLVMAGCTATTPLERKQNEDRANAIGLGIGTGALIGCGEELIRNMAGGGSFNRGLGKCGTGAAIGAGAGGVLGAIAGEFAAQRRAEFEREVANVNNTGEDRINKLAQVQRELEDAAREIQQQRVELADIQTRRKKGERVASDAKAYLDKMNKELSDGRQAEAEYTKYRDEVQAQIQTLKLTSQPISPDEARKNSQRIANLNKEYQQLVQVVRTLNGINNARQTQVTQAQALIRQGV